MRHISKTYISQTNTINGWFKNYAIIGLNVPFYEKSRFDKGSLVLWPYYLRKTHFLAYRFTDKNGDDNRDFVEINNESKSCLSPSSYLHFDMQDCLSDNPFINVIIPVVKDNKNAIELADKIADKPCQQGIPTAFLAVTYKGELFVVSVRYEGEDGNRFRKIYADKLNIPFKIYDEYEWSAS